MVWMGIDGFVIEDETIVFEGVPSHLFLNHHFCRLDLYSFHYLFLADQRTLPLLIIIINPFAFNEV